MSVPGDIWQGLLMISGISWGSSHFLYCQAIFNVNWWWHISRLTRSLANMLTTLYASVFNSMHYLFVLCISRFYHTLDLNTLQNVLHKGERCYLYQVWNRWLWWLAQKQQKTLKSTSLFLFLIFVSSHFTGHLCNCMTLTTHCKNGWIICTVPASCSFSKVEWFNQSAQHTEGHLWNALCYKCRRMIDSLKGISSMLRNIEEEGMTCFNTQFSFCISQIVNLISSLRISVMYAITLICCGCPKKPWQMLRFIQALPAVLALFWFAANSLLIINPGRGNLKDQQSLHKHSLSADSETWGKKKPLDNLRFHHHINLNVQD